MRHLDLFRRFPLKIIGWENWVQKLLEVVKTPSKSNQDQKPNYQARWDMWVSNHLVCLPRKSEKMSCLTAKAQSREREDLQKGCVPVSVDRVDKDKDGHVDADQRSTKRPVSGQTTGLFTQLEEIDIDFRVSGLPHAVVKQAQNFRVRELVKKIESHPRREALQADLQQNNVYNPFSHDSNAMIREMGNVELFEFCETIPEVQCSGIKEWSIAPVDICWLKANTAKTFTNGDWMLSQSHNTTSWCSARQNWGTERVLCGPQREKEMLKRNYEGIHDRFLRDPVYRDSQLKIGWTEEKCIAKD